MAFSLLKILKGLRIVKENTLTPDEIQIVPNGSASTVTTIQSSQTANRTLTLPNATDTLVGKATTDTLTNKTIDADGTGNVISNIDNGNIKAAAGIDATKIADGSVDNTEFQNINGLSSPAVGTTQSQTLSNKTIVAASNTITTAASGGLVATELNAALAELESEITSGAGDLATHIADTTTHGTTGNIVGTSDSQTLTNKTINADNNTITNIENADIKAGAAIDATKIADGTVTNTEFQYVGGVTSDIQTQLNTGASNLTTHMSDTTTHGTTGDIVGTSDAQIITNKDIDGGTASNTRRITIPKDTKTNLDALTRKEATIVYASDQDKLYVDDGTNLQEIGSGAGNINFILNPDAEAGTTGFATYADAAGTRPVDGTGGVPAVTWTTSATAPLAGSNSFLFTKGALNCQGGGVGYDFTIDAQDKAKVLQINFNYLVSSGTFVAGTSTADSDVIVYIYDVINAVMIEPSSIKLLSNSTTIADKFSATFQTASNSTSYRLILHVATASTAAYTLQVDSIAVSPSTYVYGTPISDWVAYTPTVTGLGTISNEGTFWRRVGDSLEIKATIVAGTVTADALSISLPAGLSIDASKNPSTTNTASHGFAYRVNGDILDAYATAGYGPWVVFSDTAVSTNLLYVAQDQVASRFSKEPGNELFASGDRGRYTVSGIPILGWSSSVQMSDQTDTRVVAAKVNNSTIGSLANAVETVLPFPTVVSDTHAGWSTSTNRYTISVAGKYRLSANARTDGGGGWVAGESFYLTLRKNGVDFARGVRTAETTHGASVAVNVVGQVDLNVGDYVDVIYFQNSGAAINLVGSALDVRFELDRISGPSAIAASEDVIIRAIGTAAQTLTNAAYTTIQFPSTTYDSHGAFTSNTTFTAPTSGKYKVYSNVGVTMVAGAQTWYMGIYRSGSEYTLKIIQKTFEALIHNFHIEDSVRLLAGQTIDIRIYNGSGADRTVDATANTAVINIERVGNY